jgi:hypothetical protein
MKNLKMKPDPFEQWLQNKPLRQIPTEWEVELFKTCYRVIPKSKQSNIFSLERIYDLWKELTQPCAEALGSCAFILIILIFVHCLTSTLPRVFAESTNVTTSKIQKALNYRTNSLIDGISPSEDIPMRVENKLPVAIPHDSKSDSGVLEFHTGDLPS